MTDRSPADDSSARPRRTRARRLRVGGLLALLLVSACTVREPGQAAPAAAAEPAPIEIAYDEDSAAFVEEFARVRTLDICAVHDVAAAERITGARASELNLRDGLESCNLEAELDDPTATWRLELRYGQRLTTDWTPLQLAGSQLRKNPDDTNCEYIAPGVDPAGLVVRVSYTQAANTGPEPSAAEVCRTAERYIAEVVLPRWNDPPALADGLTTPRIPLLGKDPCAALAAGVADVPPEDSETGTTFSMDNPYHCEADTGSLSDYTLVLDVFSAILDLQGQPVQVGELPALVGEIAGGCQFQVPVLPDLVFSTAEGTVYNGGIEIVVPTCDDVAIVEKMIDNLIAQPDAPPAGPRAQPIGDLDGQ